MNSAAAPKRRPGRKTNAQRAAEAAAAGVQFAPQEPHPVSPPPMGHNSGTYAQAMPLPTRAATREANREASRDLSREPIRSTDGVVGRNGEVLSRTRAGAGTEDVMEIHPSDIPPGWEYQWNTFSIYNEVQMATQNTMWANGWRPVPADRHPGRWTPHGHKGDIIHEGARLEERPKSLGDEARAEDKAKAMAQMRENNAIMTALGRDKTPLGDGMSMDGKQYRGVAPQIRTNFAPEAVGRAEYERE